MATNAALDESRRRQRRPRPVDVVPEAVSTEPATDARVADVLDVDAALATLPEEFRVAVALRDLAGLDYAEIATVLDIPAGTVRSRIARGRAALADALGNREGTSDRPRNRTPVTTPMEPLSPELVDELLSAELDGAFDAAAREHGYAPSIARELLDGTPGVAERRDALAAARDAIRGHPARGA